MKAKNPRGKSKPLRERLYNMQTLRRAVQLLFFALFIYLFALTIGRTDSEGNLGLPAPIPVDFFFRIDPLVGLTTMIAARKTITILLLYGIPVVLLTVLLGRFFCGWICPLGTTLDAANSLFFKSRRSSTSKPSFITRSWKYIILVAVLTAAVFSAQAAYLFDPITIITRAMTFVVYAPVQLVIRSLGTTEFLSERAPFLLENGFFYGHQFFYRMNLVFFAIFIAIIAAEAYSRRFWCRNLCPLGALLGLISQVSLIKRLVGNTCIDCGRCIRECKMSAICDDPREYIAPECIYCYSCTKVCPTDATRIIPASSSATYRIDTDMTRRRALQAIGIGIGWAALVHTNLATKTVRETGIKSSSPQLIRPPGSLPEPEFLDRCVRCSECMKVCPTNGLQPALTEAGIEGLWTPILVPKIGECAQNCNLCSKVCPTQAIQPFEKDEKQHIFIGTAVIDRSQCIVWNGDKACLICEEYCSYLAVHFREVDGVRRPFVNEKKCTGCGKCESACPIQPQAAIRVFSFGDKRHMSREEQKFWSES